MVRLTMESEEALQKRADVLEASMVKAMNAILRGVGKSFGASLTAASESRWNAAVNRAETQWMQAVGGEFFPQVVDAFATAAERMHLQMIGLYEGPAEDVPFVPQEYALEYLRDTANRMVNVSEGTWARARAQLIQGFSAGESIEELSARLMQVSDWGERRAATVARTEIISASNAGALAEARAVSPDASKEWMATRDSRTREWHREADGETVLLDGTFTVGGQELDYPGDPSGSPDNIINCRCTLAFHVPRESVQRAVDEYAELPDVSDEFDPADFVDWDTLTAALERHGFVKKPFDESKHNRGKGGKFAPKSGGGGSDGKKKIDYKKPPKKISYVKPAKKAAPASPPVAPAKKAAAPPTAKKAAPGAPPPVPAVAPSPPPVAPAPEPPDTPAAPTPNSPLVEVTDEIISGMDTDSGQFAEVGSRVLMNDRLGTVRHTRTDESGLSGELFVQFDDNPTEVEQVDATEAETIDAADAEEVMDQPFDEDAVTNMPPDAGAPGAVAPSPQEDEEDIREPSRTPFPVSPGFETMSNDDAMAMQDDMTASRPWTVGQETALTDYTGDGYVDMNGCLRQGDNCTEDVEFDNRLMSQAMRPTTRATTAFRGANLSALGVGSREELFGLVGSTVTDPGFTSTSINPDIANTSGFRGAVRLQIEVPEGTSAAYVEGVTRNADEQELVLDQGTRFEVLEVVPSPDDPNQTNVRVRVIP